MGAVLNRGLLGILSCVTMLCHRIASSLDKNLLMSELCWFMLFAKGSRVTSKHSFWVTSKHSDFRSLPNTIARSLRNTKALGNHGCLKAISFCSCTQFLQSQQSKAMPILPIASLSCLVEIFHGATDTTGVCQRNGKSHSQKFEQRYSYRSKVQRIQSGTIDSCWRWCCWISISNTGDANPATGICFYAGTILPCAIAASVIAGAALCFIVVFTNRGLNNLAVESQHRE